MKMKKILAGLLILGTCFTAAACGNAAADGSASAGGEINGGGSTSVQKIVNAVGEEYSAQNPDVTFTYSGTGSSDGIKGATEGTYSFGCASRELKDEEKAGLVEVTFAYDGIAMITHPTNAVKDLTMAQLKDIYTGKITNWSEVGGKDAPIVVVSREDGSGTRSAVEELIEFEEELKKDATIKEGNGNVQTTVAANENAIGYVSLTFVDDTVKKLNVEGIEATVDNVLNKSYPISRPFLAVYNEEKVDDATKAFLDFLVGDEGQKIVEKDGGIPLSK